MASPRGATYTTRRAFLGFGALSACALVAACSSAAPAASSPAASSSAASTGSTAQQSAQPAATAAPASGAASELVWTGWNVVDFFNPVAAEFMKENPSIKVKYTALPDYKKQTTMLAAGDADDVINTRDDDLAGYADAGFIIPLDMAFPGVKEANTDMYEGNLAAMTHKGKQYGLPYYTDFNFLVYNSKMYETAGLKDPPADLNELTEQGKTFKDKKIAQYPVYMWLKQEDNFKEPMYALMDASGAKIIDDNGNSIPDDPQFIKVLDWLVGAFQTTKIMDLSNLNIADEDTTDAFMAGKHPIESANRYDLRKLNDPKQSKIAVEGQRVARGMIMPGTESPSKGTVMWTRSFTVHAKSKQLDAARTLQFFAGAKNKDGVYWTAKSLHDRYGLGFAYKSLEKDTDIINSEKIWGDPDLFAQQKKTAQPRQGLQSAWYSEWDNAMQAEWQKAILKQITPAQAVANIAKKWTDLKGQSGG